MELTDDDYIKLINKTFIRIGQSYSKPKTMAFMADGETQELEEPDKTFTSMNFVWKIIHEIPGKKNVLMNKQQAIRFIRVVRQRILKILNTDIDFINIHLSKDERRAFDTKSNGRFIEKISNRIRDVEKKYNITDTDLYADTPKVLQKHIVAKMYENPYALNQSGPPSPMYNPMLEPNYVPNYVPSPNYVVENHSLIEKHISFFEDEMNLIDTEDKEKYKETDTPDILSNIARLKKEFLIKFKHEINMIHEHYYDKEVKALQDELIQFYTERLTSIRKSAHFKYNPKFNPFNKKLVEVRRGKEQSRKQYYDEYKKRQLAEPKLAEPKLAMPKLAMPTLAEPIAPEPIALKIGVPRPLVHKPRTRKQKTNNTKNATKVNGAKVNGAKVNGAKVNPVKQKNASNVAVLKGLPKPRGKRVSATKKIKTNVSL